MNNRDDEIRRKQVKFYCYFHRWTNRFYYRVGDAEIGRAPSRRPLQRQIRILKRTTNEEDRPANGVSFTYVRGFANRKVFWISWIKRGRGGGGVGGVGIDVVLIFFSLFFFFFFFFRVFFFFLFFFFARYIYTRFDTILKHLSISFANISLPSMFLLFHCYSDNAAYPYNTCTRQSKGKRELKKLLVL